jgi:NAD(P)-dependent dehydrogenase (short-subunit alcohol dehydrogenase family)
MSRRHDGRVAVVTGSANGIGRGQTLFVDGGLVRV